MYSCLFWLTGTNCPKVWYLKWKLLSPMRLPCLFHKQLCSSTTRKRRLEQMTSMLLVKLFQIVVLQKENLSRQETRENIGITKSMSQLNFKWMTLTWCRVCKRFNRLKKKSFPWWLTHQSLVSSTSYNKRWNSLTQGYGNEDITVMATHF